MVNIKPETSGEVLMDDAGVVTEDSPEGVLPVASAAD